MKKWIEKRSFQNSRRRMRCTADDHRDEKGEEIDGRSVIDFNRKGHTLTLSRVFGFSAVVWHFVCCMNKWIDGWTMEKITGSSPDNNKTGQTVEKPGESVQNTESQAKRHTRSQSTHNRSDHKRQPAATCGHRVSVSWTCSCLENKPKRHLPYGANQRLI